MSETGLPELPPEKGVWDESTLSRRGFLQGTFIALASIGILHIGIPAARFLVGNSLEPAETTWVEVGPIASLPPDEVTRVTYSATVTDAWREVARRGTIYAYSPDGGATFVALDGSCTHLGCIVQWKSDQNVYACPCHAGVFSRTGEVISGPPPRPLVQLPTKVENDVLYALV